MSLTVIKIKNKKHMANLRFDPRHPIFPSSQPGVIPEYRSKRNPE